MKTVSDYLACFLVEKHIDHIFGFQGSAMLKLLDDICLHGISYQQSFHEQASAFSACGYARASGCVGVAIATSGPGAVNLIGGIADAWFDSIACLFITGQDYLSNIRNQNGARQNGFQDMDFVSMVQGIAKYAVLVDRAEDIAYHLEKAFWEMEHGRKGPVVLDIPIDVQFAEIDEKKLYHFTPKEAEPTQQQNQAQYCAAAQLLKAARRPLILAGGGIRLSGGVNVFREFIAQTGIPVVATLNGLDAAVDLYGFTGLYGTTHGNVAVEQADVILVLGARLALRQVGKRPKEEYGCAKIIHIDIDPNELGRAVDEEISIRDDVKTGIVTLTTYLNGCMPVVDSAWIKQLTAQKEKLLPRLEIPCTGINPVRFARYIYQHSPAYSVCTADIGQNQMWTAQAYVSGENRRILNSGGFGSMGFSLPAAIGAACAEPDATILCFTGDGGFHMNIQELEYLKLHRPNLKCLVFNNENLGLMREVSSRYYGAHYYGNTEVSFQCVDLFKIADAYRLPYVRLATEDDFDKADELLFATGPCIIECVLSLDVQSVNRYDERMALAEETH